MTGFPVSARWLYLPMCILFMISPALGQQRAEVAITVDDLPVHGDLPANMTRAEIAKKI